MREISNQMATLKNRGLWPWILYLLLVLLSVALEHEDEMLRLTGIGECDKVTFPGRTLYKRFATVGYRKPRPHFVRLVVLSPGTEPPEIFSCACNKREFVAAVLRSLKAMSPSEIVLDFRYPPEYCNKGAEIAQTAKLVDAIRDLSKRVPIVLGEGSQLEREMEFGGNPDLSQLRKSGFSNEDQILDSRMSFGCRNVGFGLVRFNCDSRRVPVFWTVYPNKKAVLDKGPKQREPTLSYVAATTFDQDLARILNTITSKNEHPFTSFIPEVEFRPVSGIDLVCGGKIGPQEDWRKCQPSEVLNADLRGKIVLVGERGSDLHQSALGEVPGYSLHPNYIESFLDDRLFRESLNK